MFPKLYLWYMDVRENIKYEIEEIGEERYRVEVKLFNEVTLGVLYFENPKPKWVNKPIGSTAMRCVDAKVEGLYVYGGEDLTPKEVVATCQKLLQEYLQERGVRNKMDKRTD